MSSIPDVSILIINWWSADYLEKCLDAIRRNRGEVTCEIIVLDNASFDGSDEMVKRQFPEVRYVQSEENLGFAQANNLAFTVSSGRYILFLNPDTELQPGALSRLIAGLDTSPNAGIAGPRLLNSDLTLQESCIQSYPTLLNQILDAEVLRRLLPRASLWGSRALYESENQPSKVQAVSGACLLARREAFEEAGEFTAAYFMYGEDVDLCYKTRSAGWDIVHVGSAPVIHHGGQSSNRESQNNFAAVMTRESLYKFMKLRRGTSYALLFRTAMALAAMIRLSFIGVAYVATAGRYNRSSLRGSWFKWKSVLRWAFGLEGWAGEMARDVAARPHHQTAEWKKTTLIT
jgi:N-acetylglucosaminyl-diphospho-decaprenol L-rhamnosyltransferase